MLSATSIWSTGQHCSALNLKKKKVEHEGTTVMARTYIGLLWHSNGETLFCDNSLHADPSLTHEKWYIAGKCLVSFIKTITKKDVKSHTFSANNLSSCETLDYCHATNNSRRQKLHTWAFRTKIPTLPHRRSRSRDFYFHM